MNNLEIGPGRILLLNEEFNLKKITRNIGMDR
jgi:hypothetical protein